MQSHNTSKTARERFAHNLRKYRMLKELSQEGLAELSGLHRTYVGAVERGERNISLNNMERLANAMNLKLVELLAEDGPTS